MSKTLNANQVQKIDRPYVQPVYFAHILSVGAGAETLYFSDRCFNYNGHNYEDYLHDLSDLGQQIKQLGGYDNLNARLRFSNQRFRAYGSLVEFFDANPITRKEMELYVLYKDTGETFVSDVSTKLLKAAIGEFVQIDDLTIEAELFSILHHLDSKNPFTMVNATNWPSADPKAIGEYENIVYGAIKNLPCPCVSTGAYGTLADDTPATGNITLSDINDPLVWPTSGRCRVDNEVIGWTGKSGNTLTGCTRGDTPYGGSATTAAIHAKGSPVWVIEAPKNTLTVFKYLPAGHQTKGLTSGGIVKANKVAVPSGAGGYTLNTNDGGKTTLAFTSKQLSKVVMSEGSHSHQTGTLRQTIRPTSGSFTGTFQNMYTVPTGGTEAYMRDDIASTGCVATSTSGRPREYAYFVQNFGTYTGLTPVKVYACMNYSVTKNTNGIALFKAGANTIYTFPVGGSSGIMRIALAGITIPAFLSLDCDTGSPNNGLYATIYDFWIEIDIINTSANPASGIAGAISNPFAPDITIDLDGYADPDGNYGGAGTLITNPAYVRKHLLIQALGRALADIGTSFATVAATYAARAGGYTFGFVLSAMGSTPSEIFRRLDEQSRSTMKEEGGLFELTFHDGADPATVLTIDKSKWKKAGKPTFSQTGSGRIKNKIRAVYDRDWDGTFEGRKFGDYKKQTERSNATSITKYGELAEDWELPAIQLQAMAEDVTDWILLQEKDVILEVRLVCDHSARILERGDFFILNDVFTTWSAWKWRVLYVTEIPGRQEFRILGIKFIT